MSCNLMKSFCVWGLCCFLFIVQKGGRAERNGGQSAVLRVVRTGMVMETEFLNYGI